MVGASGDVDSTTLVPETLWMPSTGGIRRISILRPNLVPRQYGTAHRVNNYGFIVGETPLNGFPISKVPAAWGILGLPWKAQLPDPTLATVLSVNGTPCAETAFYGLNDHMWLVGECLEDTLGATNEAFVLVPEAEPRVHGSPSEWLGQLWRAFGASKR
jgi:hypothetical protein